MAVWMARQAASPGRRGASRAVAGILPPTSGAVALDGERHAGAVRVLDESSKRRRVGLLAQADADQAQPLLSPREMQALELITKGFSYDEIAGLMGVTRNTVMTFVRRIYQKLEVSSKAEAIFEARSHGLL